MGLLLTEAAARMLQLAPPVYPMAETAIVLYYEQPNDAVQLTPNWEGHVSGTWTRINSKGFRDGEYPPRPTPGTWRIATLGDSYSMGDGVPLEATYAKQLESLLSDDQKCEVLNCGASATNSVQQEGILRRILSEYHPHLVVLGFNINDYHWYEDTRFDRLTKAGFPFAVESDGRVRQLARDLSPLQNAKMFVAERSYLYRWLAKLKDQAQSNARGARPFDFVKQVQTWKDQEGHLRAFDAVGRMHELCQEHGAELLVVILPGLVDSPKTMTDMSEYPFMAEHEVIEAEMQRRGVACIDSTSKFVGRNPRDLVVDQWDWHFNEAGNRLVAEALAERLQTWAGPLATSVSP